MILKVKPVVILGCFVLATVNTLTNYGLAEDSKENHKYYLVDAQVVSLEPSQLIATYRPYGGGSGSPGSTLGYSTPVGEVSIALIVQSDRFYADVTHKKGGKNEDDTLEQRIELTNLRPVFVTLGTDESGRSYHLNLTPTVVSVNLKPMPFQKAANDLYRLRFHSSRIVLNDTQYIGRMMASDAEVFSIEVCDVASLEFSLHHLKNAEPWGRLRDGQITLSHPDGTLIEIGNVTNGGADQLIDGGPFVVWVRWSESQQSCGEYRAGLLALRESVASGDTSATAGTLSMIDSELARKPGPWVISSGARGINKNEIADGQ